MKFSTRSKRRRVTAGNERQAAKERLYTAVVESSGNAIMTQTFDGTITAWNPAAERLYGYTAQEAIGKSTTLIRPEDRSEEILSLLAKVQQGETVDYIETVRLNKEGSRINVSLTVFPLKSSTGDIIGAALMTRDITARKHAEEEFRLAVEASPSGMAMFDSHGTILLVNTKMEAMFGYRREEMIGQPVDLLVPQRFRGNHSQYREAYQATPQTRQMGAGRDLYGLRKDGSEFPIEIGLNPIQASGELRVLSTVIDITERKQAELALTNRTQELQRSNDDLEQFAYVASHDLQEPLRMVASYTELLGERYRGKLDEKADKYINYAVEGARRMQQLVNDLLSYSRVGTQGKPLRPTDSASVLRYVLKGLQAAIDESGAEISFDNLPMVNADEVQLAQLFQNLISNALKFRAAQPPRLRVAVTRDGSQWRFAVEDNGIGIEKEHAGRIFQMFQRLHDRGQYDGSGIGLAIAKKIVERHQGHIWFDSVPGEGATFYFTMPAATGGNL